VTKQSPEGKLREPWSRGTNVVRGFSLVHDPEGSYYRGGKPANEAGFKCLNNKLENPKLKRSTSVKGIDELKTFERRKNK